MPADMVYNHRGRIARPNRIEIRMSEVELERLNQACYELDRSASDIIRSALEHFIDRNCRSGMTTLEEHNERMD
ncbi:MAG: ribbon-helix-helix protein, CopG family [Ilumatobacteraceae bacterium]